MVHVQLINVDLFFDTGFVIIRETLICNIMPPKNMILLKSDIFRKKSKQSKGIRTRIRRNSSPNLAVSQFMLQLAIQRKKSKWKETAKEMQIYDLVATYRVEAIK